MTNTSKVVGVLAAIALGGASLCFAAEHIKIEKIMGKAFKGKRSLLVKNVSGTATDQEKKEFLDYAKALQANKAPKGDQADWKKRTDAIVAAAEDVVAGKAGAGTALKESANCKTCHEAHRPDDE